MACTICKSEHKNAIEALLREGHFIRDVGKQFGFGKNVIWAHKKNCMKRTPAESGDSLHGESLTRLKALYTEVCNSYRRARKRGDIKTAATLLSQADDIEKRFHMREMKYASQNVAIRIVDENGNAVDVRQSRPPNEQELLNALSTIYGLPFIGRGDQPEHESVLVGRLVQLVSELPWEKSLEITLRSCKGKMNGPQVEAVVEFLSKLDAIERGGNHVQEPD